MKYARIQNDVVVETCTPIEGFTIEECFHPSLIATMTPCGDDVQPGWTYAEGVFTAPVLEEPAPVESAPVESTSPEGQA